MVARGVFDMSTCQLCIEDAEDAIVAKLQSKPDDLDKAITQWGKLKTDTRLFVLQDPTASVVQATYDKFIGVMRHRADIPVLAAALGMALKPNAILSNNRDHFNDAVAARCGIQIYSCQEFIEFISEAP
jgi:hypothetical protein